ncbi:hypothetical protein Tco_0115245 [Tanacetum coccineum]
MIGMDKAKIKETVKNGQTWTRERKSVQEPEAKVKKSTLVNSQSTKVKVDNSREGVQDGRVKLVISKVLIGSPKQGGHVEEGKHKRKLGFALESLTMKAQELHNGLPRWQSVFWKVSQSWNGSQGLNWLISDKPEL